VPAAGPPALAATCLYLVAVAGRASAWEFKVVISGKGFVCC
jgi:hypothetical protein